MLLGGKSSTYISNLPWELGFQRVYCKLVHIFAAPLGPASAWNFVVFDGKLVVVGQLFTGNNFARGEYDDVFFAEYVHNLGVTVGL